MKQGVAGPERRMMQLRAKLGQRTSLRAPCETGSTRLCAVRQSSKQSAVEAVRRSRNEGSGGLRKRRSSGSRASAKECCAKMRKTSAQTN